MGFESKIYHFLAVLGLGDPDPGSQNLTDPKDPDPERWSELIKIIFFFIFRHAAFFKDHVIDKPKGYYSFDPVHAPDHWFEPVQVWEVKCADISVSPVHKAALGLVDPGKGVSLRFPR